MSILPERLTTEQLRELESPGACATPLLAQLLAEFRLQRQTLGAVAQYVQMFAEADGTEVDVDALISDLKEALDGGRVEGPSNVVPLNRRVTCPHCSTAFVTVTAR